MKIRSKIIKKMIDLIAEQQMKSRPDFEFCEYIMLCEAQEAGFLNARWRKKVNAQGIEERIRSSVETGHLTSYWDVTFEGYERRVLLFQREPYEYMSGFLAELDNLEALSRYVDEDRRKRLRSFDEDLKLVLRSNLRFLRTEKPVYPLAKYLPNHWWWQYNPSRDQRS